VSTPALVLEDHEPAEVRMGVCGLCWFPADESHDGEVAAARGELEAHLASVASSFHMGPGPHKSGSSQAVHGAKRGGRMTKATFRDGGATYQPVLLVTPDKGFPVSMFPELNEEMPAGEFNAERYNAYERRHKAFIAEDPARHIGTWVDRQTDRVHLDVVHVLTDEAEARRVAIEKGEIAYFSFELMDEVRVDGS
jgi:hypothetical protein